MKSVLVFAGSTSKTSINKPLATYAAQILQNVAFEVVDLATFNVPIFSVEEEKNGIPQDIQEFSDRLDAHDGFILSLAEHNGSYAAGFKNIFDWISRIEKVVWYNKPMFLLATSNGDRGAITVLEIAHSRISRGNPFEIPIFSLPNFNKNFVDDLI